MRTEEGGSVREGRWRQSGLECSDIKIGNTKDNHSKNWSDRCGEKAKDDEVEGW